MQHDSLTGFIDTAKKEESSWHMLLCSRCTFEACRLKSTAIQCVQEARCMFVGITKILAFVQPASTVATTHQSVICRACDIYHLVQDWLSPHKHMCCFYVASLQQELRSDDACGRALFAPLRQAFSPTIPPHAREAFSALPASSTSAMTTKAVWVFMPRTGFS